MNSAPTQTNIFAPPSNSPHYWGAGGASSTAAGEASSSAAGETFSRRVIRTSARHQRGQTIVIALLVLLLLAFVGGLFATIVTRNLVNAGRSNRVQSADYYAEAGTRFANDQLTASLDGADWRPPLQYRLADGTTASGETFDYRPPTGSRERLRYDAYVTANTSFGFAPAQDPDKAYLDAGFTRYNIGGGRYLLRVTYDPAGKTSQDNTNSTGNAYTGTPYSDPRARYIKIESIGREGTIDSTDPTTYTNATKTQLNATLVQYKAIGITDYARFETNPENRSDIMALGVSSAYHVNNGTTDYTPSGIVTPGVFDYDSASNLEQFPIPTTYGALNAYKTSGTGLVPNPQAGSGVATATDVPGGGSIHVNGSVRFFGQNDIYLNNNASDTGAFGDTVEIAGNLLLDNYTPGTAVGTDLSTAQDAALLLDPPATGVIPPADYVAPSNDKYGFDTHGGKVRDGSGGNDAQGQPRSVNRLEPPTLDTVNPVTNLTRYAGISKNSASRNTEDTATATGPTQYAANSAAYGYGQSIYVDNTNDVQHESSSLVGGYTLLDEWLHRAGANDIGSKSGWVANFYRPPGVDIVLGRQQVAFPSTTAGTTTYTDASFYGVRMTRSDVDGSGSLVGWKDPTTGKPLSVVNLDGTTQSTMTVSYKSLNASNDPTAAVPAAGTQAYTAYNANPNNDVVLYAEGNVRVHGVVSADPGNGTAGSGDFSSPTTYAGGTTGTATDDDHLPRHITIVTNGTAYIDGSLLRGNPQSSITVLAHDYVCINTTQFLAGPIVDQNPSGTNPPGAFTGDPSLRALDFSASDEVLLQEFGLTGTNPHLYISGGASSAGATAADFDIIDAKTGYSLGGTTQAPFTGTGPYNPASTMNNVPFSSAFLSTGTGVGQTGLFHTTFDLSGIATALPGAAIQSDVFQLAIRRDQGSDASTATQDFLLERAAILPMDIRIEAVLFAQTRSFFMIPGDWFNSDSTDTVDKYNGSARSSGLVTPTSDQDRYPFYGQPIDMKIVIDGSVSEARPADITAQSAWMAKWGWIPQFHGGLVTGNTVGTAENSGHPSAAANTPGVGLQIVYNPLDGFPYYTDHYLRTDIFGRPLPYAPKLPVCTGLLYAGQNTGESILQ